MTTPFVKWAGGKRWLAPALNELTSSTCGRYVEPFVGSGAAFFRRPRSRALLADSNRELVATYRAVRDQSEALIKRLSDLRIGPRVFKRFRKQQPRTDLSHAVRLIYLNRTAFNGLYRVNMRGEFNVPFGCKETTVPCEPEIIRECSRKLQRVSLREGDFRMILRASTADDVIYLDPPYTVKHNTNAFRRYNEKLFAWVDQEALANEANRLARAGSRIVVTNALHSDVQSLYCRDLFQAFAITRPTNLAAKPSRRGYADELLLVSRSFGYRAATVCSMVSDLLKSPARTISLRIRRSV